MGNLLDLQLFVGIVAFLALLILILKEPVSDYLFRRKAEKAYKSRCARAKARIEREQQLRRRHDNLDGFDIVE